MPYSVRCPHLRMQKWMKSIRCQDACGNSQWRKGRMKTLVWAPENRSVEAVKMMAIQQSGGIQRARKERWSGIRKWMNIGGNPAKRKQGLVQKREPSVTKSLPALKKAEASDCPTLRDGRF